MGAVNWVDAWAQQTYIDYDWTTTGTMYDYVVMLFKGFSILTNLGYEVAVPELLTEMACSIVAQNVRYCLLRNLLVFSHSVNINSVD